MRIGWSEIFANTDVLSPIDRKTWDVIGQTCKISSTSRVLELASGKGAFSLYLAGKFGCRVDSYELNAEFVNYSEKRARDLGLNSLVEFTESRVEDVEVGSEKYDLGVCLGALYLFRESGWRVLWNGIKKGGYLAISDLFCKKNPPPRELIEVFFEEEDGPLTLADARMRYVEKGVEILGEEECSRAAWLSYYDQTRKMFQNILENDPDDREKQQEIAEAMREDQLVRKYGEEYLGYMTFIMQKPV